jgi:hypothetical protein
MSTTSDTTDATVQTPKGIFSDLAALAKLPITGNLDLMTVALTTVLVVTIAFAWTRVLVHIDE